MGSRWTPEEKQTCTQTTGLPTQLPPAPDTQVHSAANCQTLDGFSIPYADRKSLINTCTGRDMKLCTQARKTGHETGRTPRSHQVLKALSRCCSAQCELTWLCSQPVATMPGVGHVQEAMTKCFNRYVQLT